MSLQTRITELAAAMAADIKALWAAVAGKAAADHTHDIEDVAGLQTALAPLDAPRVQVLEWTGWVWLTQDGAGQDNWIHTVTDLPALPPGAAPLLCQVSAYGEDWVTAKRFELASWAPDEVVLYDPQTPSGSFSPYAVYDDTPVSRPCRLIYLGM